MHISTHSDRPVHNRSDSTQQESMKACEAVHHRFASVSFLALEESSEIRRGLWKSEEDSKSAKTAGNSTYSFTG